jgi:hypothetical protein
MKIVREREGFVKGIGVEAVQNRPTNILCLRIRAPQEGGKAGE